MDEHRDKPRPEPLDRKTLAVYEILAGEFADAYIDAFLLNHLGRVLSKPVSDLDGLRDLLDDPYLCLRAFFGHYAFARRGKDRDDLAQASMTALKSLAKDDAFPAVLQAENGTALWAAFEAACAERKRKPNENQNRGLVQGMLELAQEVFRLDGIGSISKWVSDGVCSTGHIEGQFMRIVDIRGVGPKGTSTFLRDVVLTYDVEHDLEQADKIYIQPVDRWLRLVTPHAVPEPGMEDAADWIVAGKIGKYARRAKVSSIRFSMGVTYFGQRLVREPSRFETELAALLQGQRSPIADVPKLF